MKILGIEHIGIALKSKKINIFGIFYWEVLIRKLIL